MISLMDNSAKLKIGFNRIQTALNDMQGFDDIQVHIETMKDVSNNRFNYVRETLDEMKECFEMNECFRTPRPAFTKVSINPDTFLPKSPLAEQLAEDPAPSIDTRSIDFNRNETQIPTIGAPMV